MLIYQVALYHSNTLTLTCKARHQERVIKQDQTFSKMSAQTLYL